MTLVSVVSCSIPCPLHIVNAPWGKMPANSPSLTAPVPYTSIFYKLGSPQATSNLQWSCVRAFLCVGPCACLLIKKNGLPLRRHFLCKKWLWDNNCGQTGRWEGIWQSEMANWFLLCMEPRLPQTGREKNELVELGWNLMFSCTGWHHIRSYSGKNWNVAHIFIFFF